MSDKTSHRPHEPGDRLSADRLNAFEAVAVTGVQGGAGVRAFRVGGEVTVGVETAVGTSTRATMLVQASPVQDGSNWRWSYTGLRAIKQGSGLAGDWIADPADATVYALFNRAEWLNTDELPDGVGAIEPLPEGLPVGVDLFIMPDGKPEAWCEVPNGVTCEEA